MILYDRVGVITREVTGYDDYGNPITEDVETLFPAEVRPLDSSETVAGRSQVQSWYRMFLPPAALDVITSASALAWRGRTYEVDGDVEPHSLRGRVHHVELIAHRVSG